MKFTPMDIINREFSREMRGFNKEEVKNFLSMVSEDFEELIDENVQLKKKLQILERDYTDLKKKEEILRDTLLMAQQTKEDIKNNALKEAEMIVKESELQAEKIINNAYKKVEEIKGEIEELRREKFRLISELKRVISYTKRFLDAIEREEKDENID